jgi:N-acetylneuraminic acid mutarotase
MWAFNFQTECWRDVNQGSVVPRERAYLASVVLDEAWLIFGGKIADEQAPTEFWSPNTRYIPIWNPDDYSGEVWAFDFCDEEWEYVGCLFNVSNPEDPEECRSYHARNFYIVPLIFIFN